MYCKEFLKKIFSYYLDDVPEFSDNCIESLCQASTIIHENGFYKRKWGRTDDNTLDNVYPILVGQPISLIHIKDNIINYLEIGAGDGKTMYLNCLKLVEKFKKPVNVFNFDIEHNVFPFILDLIESSNKINYTFLNANNIEQLGEYVFDLCVCKISLHHIKDAEDLLNIINSKYILIREHDIQNKTQLIDVITEHFIYSMFENIPYEPDIENMEKIYNDYIVNSTENDNYHSRNYWKKIITNKGMKSIWDNSKKINNPTNYNRIYSELFVKK